MVDYRSGCVLARDDGEGNLMNENWVDVIINNNKPPQFSLSTFHRNFPEGSSSGHAIGLPLQASDPDGHSITFKKSAQAGDPHNCFSLDNAGGQLRLRRSSDAKCNDYEYKKTLKHSAKAEITQFLSWHLRVTATDNGPGKLTDSAVVVVAITDVNESPLPALSLARRRRRSRHFYVSEDTPVGTVVASGGLFTDPDRGPNCTTGWWCVCIRRFYFPDGQQRTRFSRPKCDVPSSLSTSKYLACTGSSTEISKLVLMLELKNM